MLLGVELCRIGGLKAHESTLPTLCVGLHFGSAPANGRTQQCRLIRGRHSPGLIVPKLVDVLGF
jgi:hypothetical protein